MTGFPSDKELAAVVRPYDWLSKAYGGACTAAAIADENERLWKRNKRQYWAAVEKWNDVVRALKDLFDVANF